MKKKILWKKEFYIKRKLFTLNKSPYSEEEKNQHVVNIFHADKMLKNHIFLNESQHFPGFPSTTTLTSTSHCQELKLSGSQKKRCQNQKCGAFFLLPMQIGARCCNQHAGGNCCVLRSPAVCLFMQVKLLIYELLRCHQTSCQKELSCANATPARKYSHPSDCQAKCHGAHSVISNH